MPARFLLPHRSAPLSGRPAAGEQRDWSGPVLSGTVRVLLILLLLGGVGCGWWGRGGAGPEGDLFFSPAGPDEFEQQIQQKQVYGIQATGWMDLPPHLNLPRVEVMVACDRSGHLRLEVFGFLNHVVFLLLVREGRFITYSVPDNLYSEGTVASADFRRRIGMSLNAHEVIALILGDPFFVPIEASTFKRSKEQGSILFDVEPASRGPRYLVWVDGHGRALTSIMQRPAGGHLHEGAGALHAGDRYVRVAFSDYRTVGSVDFPFRIQATDLKGRCLMDIEYREVTLNPTLPPGMFEFTPPAGAERVPW